MNRRRFLVVSSQAGLTAALSPLISLPIWAATNRFKNLITVHFVNGWDVTLGLDPQVKPSNVSDQACFLGYSADKIMQIGQIKLGPAAQALAPYAQNCLVINGVSMNGNISHPDSTRFAQTGIVDRRIPQITAMKAFAERDPQYDAMVLYNGYDKMESGNLEIDSMGSDQIRSLINSVSGEDSEYLEPDSIVARKQRWRLAFWQALQKSKKLKPDWAQAFMQGNDYDVQYISDNNARAYALALQSGFVNEIHLSISPPGNKSLDTHSNHKADHLPSQAICWQQVVELVQALKELPAQDGVSSVFDETLIMVTSEFSRETMLNGTSVESAGKEHNGYTNSYLLMGGRVRGGRTIGESVIQFEYQGKPSHHTARNFNFETQQVIRRRAEAAAYLAQDDIKKQIEPGHVIRTLANLVGTESILDPMLAKLPKLKLGI